MSRFKGLGVEVWQDSAGNIIAKIAGQDSESEKDANVPRPAIAITAHKDEIGAIGALYFTQNQRLDALIALEICPLSPEYPITDGEAPVLLSQDGYGIYDEGLNGNLRQVAE